MTTGMRLDEPRIPTRLLDAPSQRLYYLSLGCLCQALKLLDFIRYLASSPDSSPAFGLKWLFFDASYCLLLRYLRIPRLHYTFAVVALQITLLSFMDGVMFGGIKLDVLQKPGTARTSFNDLLKDGQDLVATTRTYGVRDWVEALSLGLVASSAGRDSHLLGQHTIRMSPISTAHLNPHSQTFCLSSPSDSILVPILLNNTTPTAISYSLIPLGGSGDETSVKFDRVELSARDLRAIEQSRVDALQVAQPNTSPQGEEYEYDDDDEDEDGSLSHNLQKTQSIAHIKISKPGILRLERVKDASNVDARLGFPRDVAIAPCPTAEFVTNTPERDTFCAGDVSDVQLSIDVSGVPPLSLKWSKVSNGRRENFVVEGIDGERDMGATRSKDTVALVPRLTAPQQIRVPMTASLDGFGSLSWTLEEVVDSLGNVVQLQQAQSSKTARSLTVLRRPSISFQHCRPDRPKALQIDSETQLALTVAEGDDLDAPWDIKLQYSPPADTPQSSRLQPWVKTLRTNELDRELRFSVANQGDYKIISAKGKWCEGDVLAPEICQVVQQPQPTAEIEWRRIHECSGDTGVSASIILHGTPPFHLYYRTQRNKEQPREEYKMFNAHRGEMSLQPDREGSYTYTFFQISDANYQHVRLHGPTIEQVVHPLAHAEFVHSSRTGRITNCEGDSVDVDVALKGSGPWNLQLQVVGPRGSEIINIPSIKDSRKTISVPIPKNIAKHGGSFNVDIIGVEDSNGCKRSISVPSASVDVRRVKPTAKFYSHNNNRVVTILEHAQTSLPLRLTGDGPWTIRYRKDDSEQVMTKSVNSPNDKLTVNDKGIYELVSVRDAHCPGVIDSSQSTYTVQWTPRPLARLAPTVVSTYEPYNSSHILPPVCEGFEDHVDLDLTGSSPFQIMYNIARGVDSSSTVLLDQSTFTSIQPRTRFQLQSSPPARYFYEVKQIGDVSYPLAQHKDAIIPRSQRLLFEQQVLKRPSARFKSRSRIPRCVGDAFTSRDSTSNPQIILEGVPPFRLKLSVKNFVSSQVEFLEFEVLDNVWTVNLPQYEFKSIGSYLVTILSIKDASHCVAASLDPLTSATWVDVSETAAISPLDHRKDYCVGDISHFQLEGTPAWQIGYRINGKSYTKEAKSSPFSIIQEQAGEFTITSISHQQKLCKAVVTDLTLNIHPLPSAQVGHGKRIYQDIHEGDQAEIVFTLIGEPPFTFTYQRSELPTKKGGKLGKVLETHTVSRVMNHEYSIFSALEGTWTVTSISDKYCRYPPAQVDGDKYK